MDTEREDRRVRRTRKRIRESLFQLMQKMPYEKIRISQITELADISRSTFYLHFETKDDVVESMLDEIISEYIQALDVPPSDNSINPSILLFSLWKENKESLAQIVEAGLESNILRCLREANKPHQLLKNLSNATLDRYVHAMVNGASYALLLEWTRDGCRVPVEDIARLYDLLQVESFFNSAEEFLPEFGQ